MGYIEEMRQRVGNHPLILIGSHAIILNENNEILLQLRTDFNRWGIIGGALEYNETLEDAVKREVFEETGLTVKNVELFRTYSGPDFFKSIQTVIKYMVYSLFIFAENFKVNLYAIKRNRKNYASFRLMSYLAIFLQLLRGLLQISKKNKGTLNVPSQIQSIFLFPLNLPSQ